MMLSTARRLQLPLLLGFFLLARLLLLVFAPLTDPSESRYAEIARKMMETGDWVTPHFDYGVPFWAKPPLSMWMSALGMELFGVNQFGARIFLFATALVVLLLVADSTRRELGDAAAAWKAALMLAAMPLFFFCSAAVMTDIALLLGTTLAMVDFRDAILGRSRLRGYGVFAGLAIGLLAKGPLALVIALPPIGIWHWASKRWRGAWRALPWVSGSLLMLVIALPWYVMAERRTPGFLNYFLIGEHWKRFTERGWQGDLYGNAHPVAPGMIWGYLLLGAFPWCLGLAVRRTQSFREWLAEDESRRLYWMLWMIWPVAFFTPARNIIATYPLPALPAMAMLLAEKIDFDGWRGRAQALVAAAFACWALVVGIFVPSRAPKHSEKELIQRFHRERSPGDLLIYYGPRKYSAEFYTEGAVRHTASATELTEHMDAPGRCFVALPAYWMPLVPPAIRERLSPVASWGDGPSLYIERQDASPGTSLTGKPK